MAPFVARPRGHVSRYVRQHVPYARMAVSVGLPSTSMAMTTKDQPCILPTEDLANRRGLFHGILPSIALQPTKTQARYLHGPSTVFDDGQSNFQPPSRFQLGSKDSADITIHCTTSAFQEHNGAPAITHELNKGIEEFQSFTRGSDKIYQKPPRHTLLPTMAAIQASGVSTIQLPQCDILLAGSGSLMVTSPTNVGESLGKASQGDVKFTALKRASNHARLLRVFVYNCTWSKRRGPNLCNEEGSKFLRQRSVTPTCGDLK